MRIGLSCAPASGDNSKATVAKIHAASFMQAFVEIMFSSWHTPLGPGTKTNPAGR
jgi:hypothetical protein